MKFTQWLLTEDSKKKWEKGVKKDNSLRKLLDVAEDKEIKDISASVIKAAIKSHGPTVERKLIAYANMIGKTDEAEKNRILKIVKVTPNKNDKTDK